MEWTLVCINQSVISKQQSTKKIVLIHAMTAWKYKHWDLHPYQLQSPGLLHILISHWVLWLNDLKGLLQQFCDPMSNQVCVWLSPLLMLIDQVLCLSVFVSLPFLILPAEKINFLTLHMSLPVSATDQVCSHHCLPYHESGRFVSASSCWWLIWPATLKGTDALLPWPLHSVTANCRAPAIYAKLLKSRMF